ncbi:ThiF family adenylyltransferase [Parafrankia sp. FMc6]|uniref:HesA/MoeB/ThiF family protein n=1 Tax=Parafrankia soli TaxID=2599596 RepID=UPI0034D6A175
MTFSAAMAGTIDNKLSRHLLRADGQEDVCLATYATSTGSTRTTALINAALLPERGERAVHGNASFTGDYFVRAAAQAASLGRGVVALHSHPGSRGWQLMSRPDHDSERSYAHLVHQVTGKPLVGMTLAGNGDWSCRVWDAAGVPTHGESVRVVGDHFRVTWNDQLRSAPKINDRQDRTVSAWGKEIHASLARTRVLVVGLGSVGLDVGLRLAATGLIQVGVMDFDGVEIVNLDRLVGATATDVRLARSKVEVARRLMVRAATATNPQIVELDASICDPAGLAAALDYDIVISCVDRPWPRGVLNTLAYADLIPVIDGGIGIDTFDDGTMRNATWRTHVLLPGHPCLCCNRQLDAGEIQTDKLGLLDDPAYISGAGSEALPKRQNVAALAAGVSASILAQFVSLTVAPSGFGAPGPLSYSLSTHTLDHLHFPMKKDCAFEAAVAAGDDRLVLTGEHAAARRIQTERRAQQARPATRLRRALSRGAQRYY